MHFKCYFRQIDANDALSIWRIKYSARQKVSALMNEVLIWHTSIFACKSALVSGIGIPLPPLSRGRDFFTSALVLLAALNLQSWQSDVTCKLGQIFMQTRIQK